MFIVGTKEPFAAAAVTLGPSPTAPWKSSRSRCRVFTSGGEGERPVAPLHQNLLQKMSGELVQADQSRHTDSRLRTGALRGYSPSTSNFWEAWFDLRNQSADLMTSQCLLDDARLPPYGSPALRSVDRRWCCQTS